MIEIDETEVTRSVKSASEELRSTARDILSSDDGPEALLDAARYLAAAGWLEGTAETHPHLLAEGLERIQRDHAGTEIDAAALPCLLRGAATAAAWDALSYMTIGADGMSARVAEAELARDLHECLDNAWFGEVAADGWRDQPEARLYPHRRADELEEAISYSIGHVTPDTVRWTLEDDPDCPALSEADCIAIAEAAAYGMSSAHSLGDEIADCIRDEAGNHFGRKHACTQGR